MVVAEARDDAVLVCELADRVFTEEGPPWLRDFAGSLDQLRHWRGLQERGAYTPWRGANGIKKLARDHHIRPPKGRFSPGATYAQASWKALDLVVDMVPDAKGVVLSLDTDGDLTRVDGAKEARRAWGEAGRPAVALAIAHTKWEAWVLAGFEPAGEHERAALEAARRRLGFDPRCRGDRLTAGGHKAEARRNARDLLDDLAGGDPQRRARCWRETPLALLRERGRPALLAEFIDEVRARLLPLLAG